MRLRFLEKNSRLDERDVEQGGAYETAKGHAPQGGSRQEMRSWVPMITDR